MCAEIMIVIPVIEVLDKMDDEADPLMSVDMKILSLGRMKLAHMPSAELVQAEWVMVSHRDGGVSHRDGVDSSRDGVVRHRDGLVLIQPSDSSRWDFTHWQNRLGGASVIFLHKVSSTLCQP